jgi:outer membrane receptor protein involved in Fe transport
VPAVSFRLHSLHGYAPRVDVGRVSRSAGTFEYVLLDARIGKRLNEHFELFVDGSNLFDRTYQEIAGVAMPGATVAVSLAIRP